MAEEKFGGRNYEPDSGLLRLLKLRFPENDVSGQLDVFVDNLGEQERAEAAQIIENFRRAKSFQRGDAGLSHPLANFDLEPVERDLESRKDVIWVGEGIAVLQGPYLEVKLALEKVWRDVAIRRLGAAEVESSGIWNPELARTSGHLADFPQESVFVFGSKADGESIKAVASFFTQDWSDGQRPRGIVLEDLELIGLNQSSVCTVCYQVAPIAGWLAGKTLTIQNRVFRNEGSKSLTRLMSFTVRDLVSFGSESDVAALIDQFTAELINFLSELGLSFDVAEALDPFFGRATQKLAFQAALGLKKEIIVSDKSGKHSFAVGSANMHRDTFSKRFAWPSQDGISATHSGCVGVGFERLALALFLQYGVELDSWPRDVIEKLRVA